MRSVSLRISFLFGVLFAIIALSESRPVASASVTSPSGGVTVFAPRPVIGPGTPESDDTAFVFREPSDCVCHRRLRLFLLP